MEIYNLDMETRPSCKSFYYVSATKNSNYIINNDDENKDSNNNDNVDNPVILHMNTQLISARNQAFTYQD